MEQDEIKKILVDLTAKIDEVRASQKQTTQHAKWALWVAVAIFVLPLIGLLFAIPSFMATYETLGNL